MVTQQGALVGIAVAVFGTTLVVLVALAIAAVRRWRGGHVGRAFGRLLALLAGVMFGTMFLLGTGLEANLVLMAFVIGWAVLSWRRGRWTDAGLIVAGAAAPWTALWSVYAWALATGRNDFDPPSVWTGLVVGVVPLGIGIGLAALGDRLPPAPRQDAHTWQPGARTIGTIATAIRGSTAPFGSQEIAAVITIVVVQLAAGLAAYGLGVDPAYAWVGPSVLSAIAGTEAYVRAIPPFNRKAFEAFGWIGEDELRRVREQTGEGPPLNQRTADAWLERHPKDPSLGWLRAEVLLLAGRNAEARETAEAMPQATPYERVTRAATVELIDWMDGRGGDLSALEAAAAELVPGSDDELRAAVLLAAARTRLRMVDGRSEPGDAALPLVEVRERLGTRADGQVGRALRRRILPVFLGLSLVFGLLPLVLGGLGLPGLI